VPNRSSAATPGGAGRKGSPSDWGASLKGPFRAAPGGNEFRPVAAVDNRKQARGVPGAAHLLKGSHRGIVRGPGQVPEFGNRRQIEVGIEARCERELLARLVVTPIASTQETLDRIEAGALFGW
jgi:hypothetical protein